MSRLRAWFGSGRWLCCLLGWCLLLLGAPALAAEGSGRHAPALVLHADTQHVSLSGHLSQWVDASAQSTLAQARQVRDDARKKLLDGIDPVQAKLNAWLAARMRLDTTKLMPAEG